MWVVGCCRNSLCVVLTGASPGESAAWALTVHLPTYCGLYHCLFHPRQQWLVWRWCSKRNRIPIIWTWVAFGKIPLLSFCVLGCWGAIQACVPSPHILHLLSAQESKDLLLSCPAPAQEEQTPSVVQQPVTSVSPSGQTEAVVLRYAAHVNQVR